MPCDRNSASISSNNAATILGDTLPLRWAYLGFQPIDIPAGATFYADILSTLQNNRYFTVELEAQPLLLHQATTDVALMHAFILTAAVLILVANGWTALLRLQSRLASPVAQQVGAANGSQAIPSETNPTSSACSARRLPLR